MKDNIWKFVKIGLVSAIVLVSVIFAIPFKSIPYQDTETYYEFGMIQESYTVNEPYVTEELCEKSEVIFDGFRHMAPSGLVNHLYIRKPDVQLVVNIDSPITGAFYIYSSAGRIIYERLDVKKKTIEISLSEGNYKTVFRENIMWSEEVYMRLVTKWTEPEEMTRYKEIVKYREVPTQTEKQRAVTKYKKGSIWQLIFSD